MRITDGMSALVFAMLLVALPKHVDAQATKTPIEFQGIWISKDPSKNEGNSGGALLEHDQRDGLCAQLIKNPLKRHNFEGVLVLQSKKMITWDGQCELTGGIESSTTMYESDWRCRGEHGTQRGKVIFRLEKKEGVRTLTKIVTFQAGASFRNVYDDKCR